MKVEKIVVGNLEENCYIVSKDNHVLIIDPGDEFLKIKELVGNREVDGILVTHHHLDHIGALNETIEYYHREVYDFSNLKQTGVQIGQFTFNVIYNPGHKEDAISFYFPEQKLMFVGDFIFENSIGRCDLEGGNVLDMKQSIEKIKKYPLDTILYPGHGNSTTLKNEIENNPFF